MLLRRDCQLRPREVTNNGEAIRDEAGRRWDAERYGPSQVAGVAAAPEADSPEFKAKGDPELSAVQLP